MGQITLSGEFDLLTCSCGATYALPTAFVKVRMDDHETFYCPNGCAKYYPQESDKEKLRREKEALEIQLYDSKRASEHWRENAEAEKRSKAAHKAHYTILKKKIKKGECPCCNKSFPDVAEHIKTLHPDYNKKMKLKK
jgi:hypothetical protein